MLTQLKKKTFLVHHDIPLTVNTISGCQNHSLNLYITT